MTVQVFQVPKVGIEPTFREEHEFESCASASSATSASVVQVYLSLNYRSRWAGASFSI